MLKKSFKSRVGYIVKVAFLLALSIYVGDQLGGVNFLTLLFLSTDTNIIISSL